MTYVTDQELRKLTQSARLPADVGVRLKQLLDAVPVDDADALFTEDEQGEVPASGGGSTTFLRADGSWAQPIGTGGSTTDIFAKPSTAHAADDEFESTTLNGAWTQQAGTWVAGSIDPYAAFAAGNVRYELHDNRRRSWMMVQPPGSGVTARLTKPVTIGANFFVWARLSFNARLTGSPANNDFSVGIGISDATYDPNNAVRIYLNETDAGVMNVEFHRTVAGVTTVVANTLDKWTTVAEAQSFQAVGIQKIGTTYHGWAFTSGGMSVYLGSQTYAPAVGSVSLEFTNSATTTPGNAIMGVDFIRGLDSAVWLP